MEIKKSGITENSAEPKSILILSPGSVKYKNTLMPIKISKIYLNGFMLIFIIMRIAINAVII